MAMKRVQLNLKNDLLVRVDTAAHKDGLSRSAFVREALELALKRRQMREADEKHRRSYLAQPQDMDEVRLWCEAQVWPEE